MKKRKAGMITFWESNENYGQLLQAWALLVYLGERGYEPFLIRLSQSKSGKKTPFLKRISRISWWKILSVRAWATKLSAWYQTFRQLPDRQFDAFRNQFLSSDQEIYYSYSELKQYPPEADLYICGSDQIWNYKYNGEAEPYFLLFGPDHVKRVSYAASFGHRHLPLHIMKRYRNYLEVLDYISVRESGAVSLSLQMGVKDVWLLPDPTLLLPKEHYLDHAVHTEVFQFSKRKKVFVYTLGNRSSKQLEEVISYVRDLPEIIAIRVSINKDYSGNVFPTIPEWLGYIADSDLVITNSFHGAIFSILFEKNFIALPCHGDKEEMNDRITTLLVKLGLEDHLLPSFDMKNTDYLISKKVDWEKVRSRTYEWKLQANQFLDPERIFS